MRESGNGSALSGTDEAAKLDATRLQVRGMIRRRLIR
jgi:hypothetical protein